MVERWRTAFIWSNIKVIKQIHRSVCLGCFTHRSWHRCFCNEIGFRKIQKYSLCCGTELGESACTLMCTEAGRNNEGLGEFNGLIPVRAACPCPVEVDCGHPGRPPHAVMTGEKFTFGSTVRYSCSGDRQLMGESLLSCQLNGHWSGPLPHCSGRGTPVHAGCMTH